MNQLKKPNGYNLIGDRFFCNDWGNGSNGQFMKFSVWSDDVNKYHPLFSIEMSTEEIESSLNSGAFFQVCTSYLPPKVLEG